MLLGPPRCLALGHPLLLSRAHQQGAESETEQPGLETTLQNGMLGSQGGSLACCATTLVWF